MDVQKSFDRITQWQLERDQRRKDVEDNICKELDEASDKILKKLQKVNTEIENYLKWSVDPISTRIENAEKYCNVREDRIVKEIARIDSYLAKINKNDQKIEVEFEQEQCVDLTDNQLLQAFNYTIFDTILFSITKGQAPVFTLISQSVLFETTYLGILRGFDSYILREVPQGAVAAIMQGRAILDELRDKEERFLDDPELWDVYAPQIQAWWTNSALPLIYGDRDEDWDNITFPSHEEMNRWSANEYSRMKYFPAIYDLVELAKVKAMEVSKHFNFTKLITL